MISGTSARISAQIANQSSLSASIATLQDQISTGKKLTQPSDDPAGNARLGVIREMQSDNTAYATNITTAAATATRADSAMANVSTALTRATELMTRAANGTQSADDRAAAALELRSLATTVSQIGAQKDTNGQPLFPNGSVMVIPIADGVQVAPSVSQSDLLGVANADGTTTDLASVLNAAADALNVGDDTARSSAIGTSLSAIQTATTQVTGTRAAQGIRAAQIDAQGDRIATDKTNLATQRSGIEDTDVSEATLLITSKLTTLEAAQAVFAKVSSQNLFNLLN